MAKLISAVIIGFLNIGVAMAQSGGTTSGPITLANPLGDGVGFAELAQRIIGWLFTLSIPICSIMVLVGGYQILTAAGDEEKFKTGRKTLTYAVIGFAVILIAGGIVSLIRSLVGV